MKKCRKSLDCNCSFECIFFFFKKVKNRKTKKELTDILVHKQTNRWTTTKVHFFSFWWKCTELSKHIHRKFIHNQEFFPFFWKQIFSKIKNVWKLCNQLVVYKWSNKWWWICRKIKKKKTLKCPSTSEISVQGKILMQVL